MIDMDRPRTARLTQIATVEDLLLSSRLVFWLAGGLQQLANRQSSEYVAVFEVVERLDEMPHARAQPFSEKWGRERRARVPSSR